MRNYSGSSFLCLLLMICTSLQMWCHVTTHNIIVIHRTIGTKAEVLMKGGSRLHQHQCARDVYFIEPKCKAGQNVTTKISRALKVLLDKEIWIKYINACK